MGYTVFSSIFLLIITIIQLNVPLATDRTSATYKVIYLLFISRSIFLLTTYGVKPPFNKYLSFIAEFIIYTSTMFFLVMMWYKHHFIMNWWGIGVLTLLSIIVTGYIAYHNETFVYPVFDEEDLK